MMFKTLFAVNCCKWVQTHKLQKKLTRQAYKRNNFKFHSLQTRFLGNLEVFKDCEKYSRVTYISGAKSRLTLIHKFLNDAHLSLKFPRHLCVTNKPFSTLLWSFKLISNEAAHG